MDIGAGPQRDYEGEAPVRTEDQKSEEYASGEGRWQWVRIENWPKAESCCT